MATAAVTSKGQITIPVEVRKKLGIKPGDRVRFIEGEHGEYILRAEDRLDHGHEGLSELDGQSRSRSRK